MMRSRSIAVLASAAAVPLAALAVGGLGAGAAAAAPTSTSGSSATVDIAKTGLGNILVDSQGRTLYLFKKDKTDKSACAGQCATFWPPLIAAKPHAAAGAKASLLGTTKRADGRKQVTYKGHPLYLFAKDTKKGQTNGQGVTAFGAAWFALSSVGNQVSSSTAPSPAPSSGGASGTPSAGGGY